MSKPAIVPALFELYGSEVWLRVNDSYSGQSTMRLITRLRGGPKTRPAQLEKLKTRFAKTLTSIGEGLNKERHAGNPFGHLATRAQQYIQSELNKE